MNEVFMSYLDFELEIGPGRGREYPVTVIYSPAGEAQATMHFPYDEVALEKRLVVLQNALLTSGGAPRDHPSPEELVVRNLGRDLFDALLPHFHNVILINRRLGRAGGERSGLRFALDCMGTGALLVDAGLTVDQDGNPLGQLGSGWVNPGEQMPIISQTGNISINYRLSSSDKMVMMDPTNCSDGAVISVP